MSIDVDRAGASPATAAAPMHTSRRLDSNFLPGLPFAKAVTPREVTDRVDIFATKFAHLVEKARRYPNEFALRYLEQRDYHRT